MADAPTQGQGAELGEGPQEGQRPAPPTSRALAGGQGLRRGLLLRAASAPTRWCKCSAIWTGWRRGGNGTYVRPGEALAAAGRGSARPGILASGNRAFSTAPPSPCIYLGAPWGGGREGLRIGRGFPSGSGKERAGKLTAPLGGLGAGSWGGAKAVEGLKGLQG